LTFGELALSRRAYEKAAGCDPCEEHTPTGEQLAGLRAILKANRVPFVDFAVWGPFGSRLSRFRKTDAAVFVGNTLVSKRVEGPHGFEAWAASWDLFAVAMVSLGAAKIGTLNKYRAGVVQLTRLFPKMWAVLQTTEVVVRSERWSRLREQIEGMIAMGAAPAGYDSNMPWDAVIGASAFAGPLGLNAGWWQSNFVLPCSLAASSGAATAMIRDVEGSTSHGQSGSGGESSNTNPKQTKAKGQPSKDDQRSTPQGPDVCMNYNYKKGACAGDGKCPHGRKHVCNVCGGNHRSEEFHTSGGNKRWNGSGNGKDRRSKKQR